MVIIKFRLYLFIQIRIEFLIEDNQNMEFDKFFKLKIK